MRQQSKDVSAKKMAEAVLIPLDSQVNRNSKDSVFCDLFSDPKNVLQLYAALHPEDDITDVTDITLVTLENQILRAQYNDLGFIVGNRLMVLVEEQSKWSINILIRFLTYIGETYQRYIRNNRLNVYDTGRVMIPQPEFYVICPNARGKLPDEICLSREIFRIDEPGQAFLDLRAKIISDSRQGDIISQYINFCRVFDEQVKLHGRTEKAVTETIRICKDKNVLNDYLSKEEVPTIMFGYFDKDYQLELLREEERNEGRKEGRVEGRREGLDEGRREGRDEERIFSIRKLMKTMNMTAQQAMDALEISAADQERCLPLL